MVLYRYNWIERWTVSASMFLPIWGQVQGSEVRGPVPVTSLGCKLASISTSRQEHQKNILIFRILSYSNTLTSWAPGSQLTGFNIYMIKMKGGKKTREPKGAEDKFTQLSHHRGVSASSATIKALTFETLLRTPPRLLLTAVGGASYHAW